MTAPQALIATYAPQPLIICDSADFDGASDYMTRGAGLTGAADSKQFLMSAWLRIDGSDSSTLDILNGVTTLAGSTTRFYFRRQSTNTFAMTGSDSGGGGVVSWVSSGSFTASASWIHILFSVDMAGTSYAYVNDVVDTAPTGSNTAIDFTVADWGMGALADGTNLYDGCLAEIYFAPAQYLDISKVSNRRKFISANGKPVYLGADGSFPTGTPPLVYQRLADGAAASTFATNLGTGGDFTITGTLTTGSTSPSD